MDELGGCLMAVVVILGYIAYVYFAYMIGNALGGQLVGLLCVVLPFLPVIAHLIKE